MDWNLPLRTSSSVITIFFYRGDSKASRAGQRQDERRIAPPLTAPPAFAGRQSRGGQQGVLPPRAIPCTDWS